jgi:subtilase family serine protease
MYNLDVSSPNSAQDEAYIDTELSGGIAPGAKINFYTSNDLWSAIEQMIHDNRDNVFSLSFGSCESGMGTSMNSIVNNWWSQAATQGISVFVSTGDSGSAGCDYNVSVTTGGLAVNGLASTPYDVAVGGTDYDVLANSFSTYVNSTNSTYYGSAKSFIPEATWNNSTTVNLGLLQNILNTSSPNSAAGSGGKSSCALLGCKGYAKPSWQAGTGVPADGVRDIPDVSLFAANGYYKATWLVCTDDAVNGTTSNCASGYIAGFGGTSTAAPATAGIFALLDQAQGKSIGLPNSQLYTLAGGSKASSIFHDTTVGNIAVPCNISLSPSGSCAAVTGGSDFTTGYNTTTGFDLATGWGSLDITQLIANWGGGGGGGKSTATVTVTPSTGTITYGQSVTVTANVSGNKGTPTGTVTLTAGTYNSGAQTLASGSYKFTLPADTLPVNSYTLSVSYSGDTNYNAASGTSSLTVTKATPTISLGTSASSITYGTSVTLTATISAGTTGSVSFQDTYNGTTTTIGTGTISSGTAKLSISTLKTGSHSIKAVYAGDTNNNTATSTAVAVTVSQATTTITLAVTKNNPTFGASITFTATLPVTATGTVTFKDGTAIIGTGTVSSGKATLAYNKLTVGSHSITAAYGGDVNYKAVTSSVLSVTVSKATPTIALSSSSNPAKAGTSVTFTATVTGPTGATAPTGTVTFKDGTTTLGTGTIASGKATYSTTSLAKGTHSITAVYGGNSNYLTATSSVLSQTIN